MIQDTCSLRFASPRVAAAALVIGLGAFAATALPVTSANAAVSTSVRSTPIGALLATLSDPGATGYSYFGVSLAVSGKTAIVGAYGPNSDAGAAYIYVKGASGWPTTPTVTLSDPAASGGDLFGESVAVSGTTAIVGAAGTNSDAGGAYIYVKGASGWPTTPTVTLLDPAASAIDEFGISVALSGNTAVVGANGTNSYAGAAYIYVMGASGWLTTPTVTLSDPATHSRDEFGHSVTVSGNTAVVGANGTKRYIGAAYIYVKGASGWPTTPKLKLLDPRAHRDEFGIAVTVSGKTAIVGAYGTNSDAGAAYIYVKGASGWPTTPTATLSDPAVTSDDSFAESVEVSGKTAIVGAFGTNSDGAAYIYRA